MSENVDAIESDGVGSSACKQQKLSPVCQLNTKPLIDSTTDVVTSTSALLSGDADSCKLPTAELLPNLETTSVPGTFLGTFSVIL